jgi:hypothetical protein
MSTLYIGKKSLIGLSLLTVWLGGCGSASPWQGAGALYIFDHGVSRCVNVTEVTFNSSNSTDYVAQDGRKYLAREPVAYYAGEQCK